MRNLVFCLSLLIAACGDNSTNDPNTGAAATAALHGWLDEQYREQLDFSPLMKSRLGDKSAHGDMDDVSEEALARQLQWRRDSVAAMRDQFSREALDAQGKLSWDLWEYRLQQAELNLPYRRHRFVFGRNGAQSGVPRNLISYHTVDTEQDMVDYISRLNQSGRYLGQYLERAQQAAEDDIRASYFDYQRTISEIGRITAGAPFTGDSNGGGNGSDDSNEQTDSELWQDINNKLNSLVTAGTLTEEAANTYREQARTALLTVLQPAYAEVSAWHEADMVNLPTQAQGALTLPNGEAYYQARLQTNTTLPLTAQEIHNIGIGEVARIQAEMEDIKRQVGFEGSLREFFTFMREDDQFYYPNTDQGRQDYLELATSILDEVAERLPDYFGILPRAELEVRRVEAFRESAGGAAHYMRGAVDGSRPGVFYAHLIDMRAVAVNRLENLAYHEGLPGHHMQISIQQELTNIPLFRANTGYTAYSEGWGLYAEFLGKEMGGYQQPYADFGRLSGEIWRAVRLVVDTGIHADGWSEAEAVQYALDNSPRPESSVRSEIRRYFNNPGQATAYKIGMLTIQDLRARAEQTLGTQFDIRAFHDTILGVGPLPMPLLEARIEAWIAEQENL
ncbi:MAG: DUF885 domain-containing protein [Pseudohongiellaceae bacterium]